MNDLVKDDCTNPVLSDPERRSLIKQLMQARLAIRNSKTDEDVRQASEMVYAAKVGLGELGPVWWGDGADDYSGCALAVTPYHEWWLLLSDIERQRAE